MSPFYTYRLTGKHTPKLHFLQILHRTAIIGMILSALFFFFYLIELERRTFAAASELSESVLRFHIRAEDNSAEAQNLKLQVRDAVLRTMEPLLTGISSREDAEQIISSAIPAIEATALSVVNGHRQDSAVSDSLVHASIATEYFPARTYGAITFPPGMYRSLTVTIGEGKGHNWWCVMYPTLCFQDASLEPDPDRTDRVTAFLSEDAQAVLCDTNRTADTESSTTNPFAKKANSVPRIRFRIFTFLNRFF